jgi:hypothetical protein
MIMQLPVLVALRCHPLTLQFLAVPPRTSKVIDPLPLPPLVVRTVTDPNLPDFVVIVRPNWRTGSKVTVVCGELVAAKCASALFAAVTRQVPAVEAVSELPDTLQLVAVPSVAVNDSFPVPLPPLVVRVSGELAVPLSDVMLRGT